jgi:hypothetical protein
VIQDFVNITKRFNFIFPQGIDSSGANTKLMHGYFFCSVSRVSTGSDFLKSESLYFRHLASLVYHLSAPHAGLSARQVDMSRLAQLTEIVDVFLKTIFCFYCAVCIVNGLI